MAEKTEKLSESFEDYLEVIFDLELTNKVARGKDIAEKMGVLQGSVTGALKSLSERGLINHEPYSYITLTPRGAKIAREVVRRHTVIKGFLSQVLMMEADSAEANACRMEHTMDQETIDRLVEFIEHVNNCPRTGPDWIASFVSNCSDEHHDSKNCGSCLDNCVAHARIQIGNHTG